MAEGQSDRDVVFRLKVEADPNAAKVLKKFGDDHAKVQKGMEKDTGASAKKRASEEEKAAQKAMRAETKALDEWRRAKLKALNADEKARAKAAADQERQAQRTATRLEAIDEKVRRQALKNQKQAAAAREKVVAEEAATAQKAAQRRMALEHESERMAIAGKLRVTEAFETSAEAIMRFSRGFVMLGLAGEENMEKMIRGLIKMQAFFDLVIGGVKMIVRLDRMQQGLRQLVLAAQLKEQAMRAANVKMINAETAALGKKAVMEGVASSVGRARRSAGTIEGVTGRQIAGFVGKGALGWAKTIGAFALKFAGFVAIAGVATEVIQGVRRAFGDTSKSAESLVGALFSQRKAAAAAKKSTEDLTRAMEKREAVVAAVERNRLYGEASVAGAREIRESRMENQDIFWQTQFMKAGMEGTAFDLQFAKAGEQRGAAEIRQIQMRLERARRRQSEARTAGDQFGAQAAGFDIANLRDDAIEAANRTLKSTHERMRLEKQIAKERIDAADKAIDKAEQERDVRLDAMKAEFDRFKSGAERFGAMSRGEQQRLIRIKQKADRGEELSVREAEALGGLGTRSEEAAASKSLIRKAERAGYTQFFGGGERKEITRLQAEAATFEATIRDQRELKVTVQQDTDDVVDRLSQVILDELAYRDALLVEKITARVEAAREEADKHSPAKERERGREAFLPPTI